MPIKKLRIKNFKGVRDQVEFQIRPITLFIGPNSSGKSSCIHAIAALAQSAKLPSSGRPLVLDDEYAQVHLGRYIEVIHTKKYSDAISIGFDTRIDDVAHRGRKGVVDPSGELSVDYEFKSTKRTQDVYLNSMRFKTKMQELILEAKALKTEFSVLHNGTPVDAAVSANGTLTPSANIGGVKDVKVFDVYIANAEFGRIAMTELARVLYLGPFRQSPLRRYPTRGASPAEVGAQGESTVTLLANEHVQTKRRTHIEQVSAWLAELGLAHRIEVSRLATSDLFDVQVQLSDGASLPIADLGYGMSQVLPVLTQCSFAAHGSTLLFEQPELHLHSRSAEKLAKVFVQAAKEKNLSIVAETHSRELLIGLLREIEAKKFSVDDLAVYTVVREGGCSVFKWLDIEVDEAGKPECYDPWDRNL